MSSEGFVSTAHLLGSPAGSKDSAQEYAGSAPLQTQQKGYDYDEEDFDKDKVEIVQPEEAAQPIDERKLSGFFASSVNLLKSIIGAGMQNIFVHPNQFC